MNVTRIMLPTLLSLASAVALAQEQPGRAPLEPRQDKTQPSDRSATPDKSPSKDSAAKPKSGRVGGGSASDTARVLHRLHGIHQTEIRAGNLAKNRGSTEDIREYGQTLVEDHQEADEKVTSMAQERGIKLSAPSASESETELRRLESAEGRAFDSAFLSMMVSDHQSAISQVKAWRAEAGDEDLNSMLEDMQETFQEHLDKARELQRER